MTRPLATAPTGLPNTEAFPYQAREAGRRLGLYGSATIDRYSSVKDSGGSPRDTYTPDAQAVDARVDPIGQRGGGMSTGDKIDETSTHVITFRDGVTITTKDRVTIEGHVWKVTALREQTDRLVTQVEASRV